MITPQKIVIRNNVRLAKSEEGLRASYFSSTDEAVQMGDRKIRMLDRIYLESNRSIEIKFSCETCVLFLPLVGQMEIVSEHIGMMRLWSENVGTAGLFANHSLQLLNPTDGPLDCLVLAIDKEIEQERFQVSKFSNMHRNALFEARGDQDDDHFRSYFGVFDGRKKFEEAVKSDVAIQFAFVMNGAFEIEDRLVEYTDLLCLSGTRQLSFEALSENAVIIIIECLSQFISQSHNITHYEAH